MVSFYVNKLFFPVPMLMIVKIFLSETIEMKNNKKYSEEMVKIHNALKYYNIRI